MGNGIGIVFLKRYYSSILLTDLVVIELCFIFEILTARRKLRNLHNVSMLK
jgi:hypothetical protein